MKSHRSRVAGPLDGQPTQGLLQSFFLGALGGVFLLNLTPRVHGQAPGPGGQQTALGIQQQTDRIKSAQQMKPPGAGDGDAAPETYPGESADMGPQMLLKKKKQPPLFEASTDTSILWTNNARFANWADRGDQTAIFNEFASFALAPQAVEIGPGKLSLRTGYSHVFSVYDLNNRKRSGGLNDLNFQVSTFFAGARYNFAENWNASFRVDYTRILGRRSVTIGNPEKWRNQRLFGPMSYWPESVVNISPSWSLERGIALGEKVGLSLGYSGAYHFTEMDSPMSPPADRRNRGNLLDRLETAFSANLSWAVSETISVNPGLRVAHGLFTRTQSVSDRGERRRTVTASPSLILLWAPKPFLSTRLGVSADFFRSNDPDQPSYNKVDLSTGVSLNFKF
jgi:hypothetical protein